MDGVLWPRPRDGGGRVVWERPRVRFSEALCSLGLVRYVDMYGGTDDDGRGDWLEWDQFYHLMEAARRGVAAQPCGDGGNGGGL